MNKRIDCDAGSETEMGYQLRSLPDLQREDRSARVLAALARMENRPVALSTLVARYGFSEPEALDLLIELNRQGCLVQLPLLRSEADHEYTRAWGSEGIQAKAARLTDYLQSKLFRSRPSFGLTTAWADTAVSHAAERC